MSLTSMLFLLGAAVPPGYTVARVQQGLAAVYWPGDGNSGKTCADGKPFTKERCHVAHRTWPLGSRVRVCSRRTKRCAVTFVGDRGPYGACDHRGMDRHYACKGRWIAQVYTRGQWLIRHRGGRWRVVPRKVGRWRGIVDLSRCVWKKIGGSGLQPVRLELLRKKRKRRTKRVAQANPLPTRGATDIAVPKSATVPSVRTRKDSDASRLWSWYAPFVFVVRRRSSWR
jgi:rare lipoprotein A (peptidoglycan hydrolase)